jgi:hypothetical protein
MITPKKMNKTYASPSSFMDSSAGQKKIVKGERIGVRSLVRSTLGVKGHDGVPRWDQEDRQVSHLFTRT